jgi:hypothetical protein
VLGRLRQEDPEFKASLGCIAKRCLTKKHKKLIAHKTGENSRLQQKTNIISFTSKMPCNNAISEMIVTEFLSIAFGFYFNYKLHRGDCKMSCILKTI